MRIGQAGTTHELPRRLLPRAWLRFVEGKRTGSESAQSDLDEAWEIAERGSMKLFMADIHLYRARLFGSMKDEGGRMKEETAYPWESPAADLAAAETLINPGAPGRLRPPRRRTRRRQVRPLARVAVPHRHRPQECFRPASIFAASWSGMSVFCSSARI